MPSSIILYGIAIVLLIICAVAIYILATSKIDAEKSGVPKGSIVISNQNLIYGVYALESISILLTVGLCVLNYLGRF